MTTTSHVDLSVLATGLSFDISVNVPNFREVQFLFVQQDSWWMLSINKRPAFRLATFTVYNLHDFIDDDLDFTFQLKPKNLSNQTVGIDDIAGFYLVLKSGDGFDDQRVKSISPDYVYSDKVLPFDDFLLNPLPLGASQFAYLTQSNIEHTNLEVTGWENLIGDTWDYALNAEIGINTDFNMNCVEADSTTVLSRSVTTGQDIESAPTVIMIFKPTFAAMATEYNLVQVGTDNDSYLSITQIDASTVEYKSSRGADTTLQGSYSSGSILGVIASFDKTTGSGQNIRLSTGETIDNSNNSVNDVGGTWGILSNAGRDLVDMQIIEVLLLPPFQNIIDTNSYINYLNKKYGLSFTLII